jgi:hypothetical protein
MQAGDTGLQAFILAMTRAPAGSLSRADPARLAVKYEISEEAAGFYLRMWRARG